MENSWFIRNSINSAVYWRLEALFFVWFHSFVFVWFHCLCLNFFSFNSIAATVIKIYNRKHNSERNWWNYYWINWREKYGNITLCHVFLFEFYFLSLNSGITSLNPRCSPEINKFSATTFMHPKIINFSMFKRNQCSDFVSVHLLADTESSDTEIGRKAT